MEFVELITENEWRDAFPVLASFRPALSLAALLDARESLHTRGYQLFGLRVAGQLVSVAGLIVLPHVFRGSELRVNDLVTAPDHRSSGYGAELLSRIEAWAKELGCSRVLLYSRLPDTDAHRFYESKAGYSRYGVEFSKELD